MEEIIKKILIMQKRAASPIGEIELPLVLGCIEIFESNKDLGINVNEDADLLKIIGDKGDYETFKRVIRKIEVENSKLDNAFTTIMENITPKDMTIYNMCTEIKKFDMKKDGTTFIKALLSLEKNKKSPYSPALTPSSINYLIPRLLKIESGTVYDGTFGKGSTEVADFQYATENNLDIKIYGQDIDEKQLSIGRLNLLVNGCTNFSLKCGDTLAQPKFTEGNALQKFDFVTMHIPTHTMKWDYEAVQQDIYNRYKMGMPPKNNSNYAFIQHAIASTKDYGKAAIVIPQGALSRGAMEKEIRLSIVRQDLIEGIIYLPARMMEQSPTPLAILIISKNKREVSKYHNQMLLIKADDMGTRVKSKVTLDQDEMDKIIDVYNKKVEIEGFSKFLHIPGVRAEDLGVNAYFDEKKVKTEFGEFKINDERFEENKTVQLQSLATFVRGSVVNRVRPSQATHKAVMLSDVQDGKLQLDHLLPITMPHGNNRNYPSVLRKGDILLSCRGNIIKVAVVEDIPDNIVVSHNFIAIRPHEGVNPYFIKAYLESPVGQYYITRRQTGMTVSTLSVNELYDIPFPDLTKEEQAEIGNKLLEIDKNYNKKLEEIKDQFKDDMFDIYYDLKINKAINKM